jgi:hypothetical protein
MRVKCVSTRVEEYPYSPVEFPNLFLVSLKKHREIHKERSDLLIIVKNSITSEMCSVRF